MNGLKKIERTPFMATEKLRSNRWRNVHFPCLKPQLFLNTFAMPTLVPIKMCVVILLGTSRISKYTVFYKMQNKS